MSNKKIVNVSVTASANKQKKKNKSTNNSQVVKKTLVVASKSNNKKPNQRRTTNSATDSLNYKMALMDPFNSRALGARLPDEFALPTATYHMHSRFALNAVGTGTSCSFLFSGQPFQTFMCGGGSSAEFSTAALPKYTANPSLFYAATETAIRSQFTSYRVVSSGLRIRGLQPLMTATGRVVVARVPLNTQLPGPTLLENTSFTTSSLLLQNLIGIGLDADSGEIPLNILQLPEATEYTLGQLATNELCINNRICSSDAYRMHSTLDATTVSSSVAFGVTSNGSSAATTYAQTESLDTIMSAGQTAILVRCEGVSAGIDAAARLPILDVEFMIHVEGVPTITNGSNAVFVPATLQAKPSVMSAQRIIAMASQAPFCSFRPRGGRRL